MAKWRAVINIVEGIPSDACLEANARALARYAALCIEAGLVPIVEPEVLMDGPHDLKRCLDVTECPVQAGVREVAEATLSCFRRALPAAAPRLVFLSGCQSDDLATQHLNEMNALGGGAWELRLSYGRSLRAAPLRAWSKGREGRCAAEDIPETRALPQRAISRGVPP